MPPEAVPEKGEAICFTAGAKGSPFGAGVIHAWIASGRKPPVVAAGISAGALTAAAMQRCFTEYQRCTAAGDEPEAARWKWFRRYLEFITIDPMAFFWRAFPNPVDFAADQPPVTDASCPELKDSELRARRHYYLLTLFGVWLAKVPIRVSTIANFLVHWVRKKERYGGWVRNHFWLSVSALRIFAGLAWHVFLPRRGNFLNESQFGGRGFRPLFGWAGWLASAFIVLSISTLLLAAAGAILLPDVTRAIVVDNPIGPRFFGVAVVVTSGLIAGIVMVMASGGADKSSVLAVSRYLFGRLELSKNLLDPYHLERRLRELFGEGNLNGETMHVLLVAACLQSSAQYSFDPGTSLIAALMGSLARPGIFPPIRQETVQVDGSKVPVDVIDGVAVRQNPLPALFTWLIHNPAEAARLEDAARARINVVYNVPIEPYNPKPGEGEEPVDIVEAAFASQQLAKRRDTRQEVSQSNFTAALARAFPEGSKPATLLMISAQEIAPSRDISFPNPWEPKPREILSVIAAGCRATLERIHRDEIRACADPFGAMACDRLLSHVAGGRQDFITAAAPGLSEVCESCTRVLHLRTDRRPEVPPAGVTQTYGFPHIVTGLPNAADFDVHFKHLRDENGPRVVFVASGGVFRGAFHIGAIGALHACSIKPGLIVGASVGALMGGALAAISISPAPQAKVLLHKLADVFLHVDRDVALTRSFKHAVKQLGVRLRQIDLAPSEVRRMVLGGSKADPGYAATGAPPALIDAISGLFLIPHAKTAAIAGEFVAGHFALAVNRFLAEVRCETLPSLDIQHSLIGTSLLETAARQLLGGSAGIDLQCTQPYSKGGVAIFATTSYLNRRMPLLLGRDFLTHSGSYDFVKAALSSSAFPTVFSPRNESEVVPGRGQTDVFFADGGMFDNLPFLPAIEVLTSVQRSGRVGAFERGHEPAAGDVKVVLDRLAGRVAQRDVFIAAGLNADPCLPPAEFDTFVKIAQRANSLSVNGKIDSFVDFANQTHTRLESLLKCRADLERELLDPTRPAAARTRALQFLDGIVDASILKIVPADKEHINGTFAFCQSTGMKRDRVQRSIADGCFQTLRQLAKESGTQQFVAIQLDPPLTVSSIKDAPAEKCAWFARNNSPIECPFASSHKSEIAGIRQVCAGDSEHRT